MDIFGNVDNSQEEPEVKKIDRQDQLDFAFLSRNQGHRMMESETKPNFLRINLVIIGVFIIILGKLFVSQIVLGQSLEELAYGNKIRPRVIKASRGLIVDNKGMWLARNTPSFDLALYPSDLPKEISDREKVYQQISEMSGINSAEIKEKAELRGLLSLDLVVLKENLGNEEALLLEEKTAQIAAIFVAKRASREYQNLFGLSHVVGYTGKVSSNDLETHPNYYLSDWIGKTGLEAVYEMNLKGNDGVEHIEVDSIGNIARIMIDESNREPVSGNDITLYLDYDLQQKSYQFLSEGIETAKKEVNSEVFAGVVIAMNPKNGGILSMVAVPSYDNNLFAKSISNDSYQNLINDQEKPMFNRAVSGTYPPGSIIKIVMASAGLASGAISVNTAFDTPEAIEIGEWRFPDWKDHGYTNIERAIAESNNIFFYAIGGGFENIRGMGILAMKEWWEKFGLGSKTGIDLTAESSGLLPYPEWKEKVIGEPWYLGDTYHAAIGQGDLLVTPLQMVRATATIANGGKLLKPQLVQRITDSEGNIVKEFGPIIQNAQVADPYVILVVQRGMRMAVTEGSARNLLDVPVAVAGKTGTAQFFGNQKTHAWFECYAPYEDPEIALIVLVEGGGGGYEIAAPIAKNILNYYFTR